MGLVERVRNIILTPATEWAVIERETTPPGRVLFGYVLPLAIGGVFISLFVSQLGGRSLLPVNDPALDKALHHHVH